MIREPSEQLIAQPFKGERIDLISVHHEIKDMAYFPL